MFGQRFPVLTLSSAFAVSYLVVFHMFLMLFIWSYWKTIGSKATGPSEAVRIPLSLSDYFLIFPVTLLNMSISISIYIYMTYDMFFFSLSSVCFAPSRKRVVRAGGACRYAAGNPEKSGEEPPCVHSHSRRRWGSELGVQYSHCKTTTFSFIHYFILFLRQNCQVVSTGTASRSCKPPLLQFYLFVDNNHIMCRLSVHLFSHWMNWVSHLTAFYSLPQLAVRYCDHCQIIKPDRCHHCSTCEM